MNTLNDVTASSSPTGTPRDAERLLRPAVEQGSWVGVVRVRESVREKESGNLIYTNKTHCRFVCLFVCLSALISVGAS